MEQEEANNEEIISKSDSLMGSIASPPPESQIKPSDEKTINQEFSNDDQIIN